MSNSYPQDQPCAPPNTYNVPIGNAGGRISATATIDETDSFDWTAATSIIAYRAVPGAAPVAVGTTSLISQTPAAGTAGQTECALAFQTLLSAADTAAEASGNFYITGTGTFTDANGNTQTWVQTVDDEVTPARFVVRVPGGAPPAPEWNGCPPQQGT